MPSAVKLSSSSDRQKMAALVQTILLLTTAGASFGFLLDDNSVQSLLTLIADEKQLRASLETEIGNLRSNIAQVRARHEACKNITVLCTIRNRISQIF